MRLLVDDLGGDRAVNRRISQMSGSEKWLRLCHELLTHISGAADAVADLPLYLGFLVHGGSIEIVVFLHTVRQSIGQK